MSNFLDMWFAEYHELGSFGVSTVRDALERNRVACLEERPCKFVPMAICESMEAALAFNRGIKRKRRANRMSSVEYTEGVKNE